jgi:hypothetical protein
MQILAARDASMACRIDKGALGNRASIRLANTGFEDLMPFTDKIAR